MNAVLKLDCPFHAGAVARLRLGDESAAFKQRPGAGVGVSLGSGAAWGDG